jgi:hypothetical protein|tara:strand:- start:3030 stop:4085 length:1056 start_codon:yes stop_codon:yes gene_type:complete
MAGKSKIVRGLERGVIKSLRDALFGDLTGKLQPPQKLYSHSGEIKKPSLAPKKIAYFDPYTEHLELGALASLSDDALMDVIRRSFQTREISSLGEIGREGQFWQDKAVEAAKSSEKGALAALKGEYKASFDPQTYYHVSPNPEITTFNPKVSADKGLFAAYELNMPEVRGATFFSPARTQMGKQEILYGDEGHNVGAIYPVRLKTKDIFEYWDPQHVEKLKKEISSQPSKIEKPVKDYNLQRSGDLHYFNKENIERWIEEGDIDFTGVERGNWSAFENVNVNRALKDLGYRGYHTSEEGTIGLFFPHLGDVRSIFAKFDPVKAQSGHILASVPIGGLMVKEFLEEEDNGES